MTKCSPRKAIFEKAEGKKRPAVLLYVKGHGQMLSGSKTGSEQGQEKQSIKRNRMIMRTRELLSV